MELYIDRTCQKKFGGEIFFAVFLKIIFENYGETWNGYETVNGVTWNAWVTWNKGRQAKFQNFEEIMKNSEDILKTF